MKEEEEKKLHYLFMNKRNEEALELLENIVLNNPEDIDTKIKLALYLQRFPFLDYHSAVKVLDTIITSNQINVKAVLLKGYIEDIHKGQVSKSVYDLLENYVIRQTNEKYWEQAYYLMALFYFKVDEPYDEHRYLYFLNKLIEADPASVRPYYLLSKYYKVKYEFENSYNAIIKAINNVTHIYTNGDTKSYNPIDFDELIMEEFKMVHITEPNFESLLGMKSEFEKMLNIR